MQLIFDTCRPRPEVLSGELKDEIFAARLKDVIDGTAEAIYGDPATFFRNTFPTQGLRTLLAESLGRVTGVRPSSSPAIRLETAFGGGKTHNLIALYHTATGRTTPDMLDGLVEANLLPQPRQIDVVGVVGTDLNPADGLLHQDGVRTFTIWGELAYQIGRARGDGRSGYELARQSDIMRVAPGTGLFEELTGGRPTLIMIDEIARHLRSAKGIAVERTDLAEQTVGFLMSLLEFAASRANVSVVLTLASAEDAFEQETQLLRSALEEAKRVSARQEFVIQPTGETEISAIVRHRLFEEVDADAAQQTAAAYAEAYKRWFDQNTEIPQRAIRADYVQEFEASYPFHPELLTTLEKKTSTIPNFQKTRGALRLLARVVRRLWEQRPTDAWAIHLHHIDLSASEVANDLTSRLERPQFQQVIEADIVNTKAASRAHAREVDEPWVTSGKPPYARRTATTVLLHSLTQGIATGVAPADLRLAVLQPGDDPLLIDRALDGLDDTCWFFEWDGHRYRFKTEPSLNKIVMDEMEMILRTKAKGELDDRIRQVWRKGTFSPVYFPHEASGVDDDSGPMKLAILHYDAVHARSGQTAPPDLVQRIAEYAGATGTFRRFRNNLAFLVADEEQVETMVEVMRRYLAIARITSDGDRMRELGDENRKKLKKMGEAAELDVRVAITRTYRHLYYTRADAPKEYANLAQETLPPQEQGEVNKDQSEVVLKALRGQNKVLTGDDKPLAAAYVRSRAWDQQQVHMSTEDLRKQFARRVNLPVLLDLNQLKKTIQNGIETKQWILYDVSRSIGFDHESPPPAIQVSDDVILYTPAEAQRLGLVIRGKEPKPEPVPGGNGTGSGPVAATCPLCGNSVDACTCGEVVTPRTIRLHGEGPPQQAVQQLLDACHDQGIKILRTVTITVQGDGKDGANDLKRLGLALPQLGKGQYRVSFSLIAGFGDGEHLRVEGTLNDSLYKRLKQVTDQFAQEATDLRAVLKVQATYESGLAVVSDDFRNLHEVLTTVSLGKLQLDAAPLGESKEVAL